MNQIEIPPNDAEETLEQRLDRINFALQTTMQEIEFPGGRISSRISFLNSFSTSYNQFEWLDEENEISLDYKVPESIEQTLEQLLIALDRAQMQIEDFTSEAVRNQLKTKSQNEETEKYILKLEKENRELRSIELIGKKKTVLDLSRNNKLDLERKRFEENLIELDKLKNDYSLKYRQINQLQQNLKLKEALLDEKEKELRISTLELQKLKKEWEQSIIFRINRSSHFAKKSFTPDTIPEEAPPPALIISPNKLNEIQILQKELFSFENLLKSSTNFDEITKTLSQIEQLKNKISALRSEEAVINSSRSSKLIKAMKTTMEKEVNYEEHLRKMHLDKYIIKGLSKTERKVSEIPTFSASSSKRYLFKEV